MAGIAKIFITLGSIFLLIGLGIIFLHKSGFHLTKLPGDITHQSGNTTLYFPITTCILVSFILSLLSWLIKKIF